MSLGREIARLVVVGRHLRLVQRTRQGVTNGIYYCIFPIANSHPYPLSLPSLTLLTFHHKSGSRSGY